MRDIFLETLEKDLHLEGLNQPREDFSRLVHENLISPVYIKLPLQFKSQIETIIQDLWSITQDVTYRQKLGLPSNSRHASVCNSVDLHLSGESCKIIEVNTNAAFLLLGAALTKAWGLIPSIDYSGIAEMFNEDAKDFGLNPQALNVGIVDEKPQDQRLFIEFLAYKALLKKFGISCEISDIADNLSKYNYIYNRYTDFYLENPSSQQLATLYRDGKTCVSPDPEAYKLLADKIRLQEIPVLFPSKNINKFIPQTKELNTENSEEIWKLRKGLFFKPQSSFGSKSAFKGASISRKVFDDLVSKKTLAQEYIQAPEVEYLAGGDVQKMKFDLRCYFFKDRFQLAMARLYQGQTTNLKTPHGGFAPVVFTNCEIPTAQRSNN